MRNEVSVRAGATAKTSKISKGANPLKIVLHQLYLLQLENYDLLRFWRLLKRGLWRPLAPRRKPIVWTVKLTAILIVSLAAMLAAALFLSSFWAAWWLAVLSLFVLLYLFAFLSFVFLSAAVIGFWPLDYLAKAVIVWRAGRKLKNLPNLRIVGITGSYGKTTMKEALAAVLAQKFKVVKTPENINTPLGLARLILYQLKQETEVFVVEMGAYRRGDIRRLCAITPPDVSILTGINEAHLERFGSLADTIAAKFEIVQQAKPGASVLLNADNDLITEQAEKYLGGRRPLFYSSRNHPRCKFTVRNLVFAEDGSGLTIELLDVVGRACGPVKMQMLGEYAAGMAMACLILGRELGLQDEQILKGLSQLSSPPHRLQVIRRGEIIVIDDSYNGNPDGAAEAIKVLSRFKSRRKIYVTPGLVEMGKRTHEVHEDLGQRLAAAADIVILIRNSVTPLIAQGLKQAGFDERNLLWFESMIDVQSALPGIVKKGDAVLFQNDWPDNYL